MPLNAARVPRATCQLFGAIKTISNIKNSVVLVHGPKGCVYHINYILGMRGDKPPNIYSTCMDETDVIFGAADKLKKAIAELDEELNPDLIAVLSCCASSIIGEDVESVVREVQASARLIGIDAAGFEGDYRAGYSKTLQRLIDVFAQPSVHRTPTSVNLVGLLRGGSDLSELRRALGLIGVRVNTVLTAQATIDQIEQINSAALNVVVCEGTGKESAEMLEARFGVPYIIEDLPMGYRATRRFLIHVANALGLVVDVDVLCPPSLSDAAISAQRVAVIGGPTRAIAVTNFLRECGIEPVLVVSDFDVDTASRMSTLVSEHCEVLVAPDNETVVERCKALDVDLILGGMLERPIASCLSIAHIDIMHGSEKTLGFAGADALIKRLHTDDTT